MADLRAAPSLLLSPGMHLAFALLVALVAASAVAAWLFVSSRTWLAPAGALAAAAFCFARTQVACRVAPRGCHVTVALAGALGTLLVFAGLAGIAAYACRPGRRRQPG